MLRAGKATEARAIIGTVVEEMTREVNPGEKAAHAFGLAMMLRALAEAGNQHEREAIWDWHVAQQIDPPIENWDLHEFGAAGEMLDRHRLSADPVPATPEGDAYEEAGGTEPTVALRGRKLAYVEKSRLRRWQGMVVISTRIDAQGIPTYPRLSQTSSELGIVLNTCEYARALRFNVPRWNGKPIAFMYDLTVNYILK